MPSSYPVSSQTSICRVLPSSFLLPFPPQFSFLVSLRFFRTYCNILLRSLHDSPQQSSAQAVETIQSPPLRSPSARSPPPLTPPASPAPSTPPASLVPLSAPSPLPLTLTASTPPLNPAQTPYDENDDENYTGEDSNERCTDEYLSPLFPSLTHQFHFSQPT